MNSQGGDVMANANEAVVIVTRSGGILKCNPNWVNLYWRQDPETGKPRTTVRWAFEGAMGEDGAWVGIEFLAEIPPKFEHMPGFLPDPVFDGVRSAPPTRGSNLPDIVTIGYKMRQGYFRYNLMLYDRDGNIVAKVDPGGTSDPTIPPTNHPDP
jgi:hypothetical protein